MHKYRITCLFQADWPNLIPALFGSSDYSFSDFRADTPNIAIIGFDTPQTPVNLGPLVTVETL